MGDFDPAKLFSGDFDNDPMMKNFD
jgi:hypothetical protein